MGKVNPEILFVGRYKIDEVNNYSTIEDCFEYIKDKSFLGIDIETTRKDQSRREKKSDPYRGGLDPYLSEVVMLQIGNYERIYVIDVRDFSNEEMKPITDFLDWNKNLTLIGVNLKFESKHLKLKYGINFHTIVDCMIQEMCLYNGLNRSYSLAGMAKEYLGVMQTTDFTLFESAVSPTMDDDLLEENAHLLTPFEVADSEQIDKSTRLEFVTIGKKKFTAKQVLYGADDILYPLLIAERQMLGRRLPNGEVYCPKKLFKLENKMVLVNADIELNGMGFDKDKWIEIEKEKREEYETRLNELNSYIIQNYPKFVEPPNLFDFERRCNIEWSSPKQVIELFRFLNICPKEFSKQTKREEFTVGAVALLKIVGPEFKDAYATQKWMGFDKDEDGKFIEDNDRLILAYLLMKRSEQCITTFGTEWLKYIHPTTGRVHSSYRQILNSGRMSSSKPNLTQIPNGVYRDAFKAEDGGSIISADFSNQEMRTVACLAGEQVMIQVFTEGHPIFGDDLHMATADSMNKALNPNADYLPKKGDPDFTHDIKKKRDNAKIVNFGIIYGKEAKGFAEDFGMSLEDAEDFISTYFKAYPGLQQFMKDAATHTFRNNYIQIDPIVDRRWFSTLFDEMNETFETVKEFYPSEYFTNRMSADEKAEIKEEMSTNFEVKSLWRRYFSLRGMIQRKSTNFRVQGLSGTETKTALVMLRNKIISDKIPVMIINSVHDELLIESSLPPDKAGEHAAVLEKIMEDGANIYLNPPIMKAEASVGLVWVH